MKIFVAYGYNNRDRWVRELVVPLLEAFGDNVETGEELQGQQITDAVPEKIRNSDALIAFTTKRAPADDNTQETHRWVVEELAAALTAQLRVVEVRERGVTQSGIMGDRQPIWYEEKERDKCLIELVKTIIQWHREAPVRVQLRSTAFVEQVRPLLSYLRCTCKVMEGVRETEFETKIRPIKGGLFIDVSISRQAFLQVRVEVPGQKSWTSDFETLDAFSIDLKQD
jgi:hypothetical protein